MEMFNCEICLCATPKSCEGSEPNTCANCMPIKQDDDEVQDDI